MSTHCNWLKCFLTWLQTAGCSSLIHSHIPFKQTLFIQKKTNMGDFKHFKHLKFLQISKHSFKQTRSTLGSVQNPGDAEDRAPHPACWNLLWGFSHVPPDPRLAEEKADRGTTVKAQTEDQESRPGSSVFLKGGSICCIAAEFLLSGSHSQPIAEGRDPA